MSSIKIAMASALVICSLSPLVSMADPIGLDVTVQCPIINNASSTLSYNGDYVAGYGVERLSDQLFPVYFKSDSVQNIPDNMNNYENSNASYSSSTGLVTCSYRSSMSGEAPFDVAYTITNGKGGAIVQSTSNSVEISIPFGLKK